MSTATMEDSITAEQLLAEAQAIDNGAPLPSGDVTPSDPADGKPTKEAGDPSQDQSDPAKEQSDDIKPDTDPDPNPEPEPETAYNKAKKEAERRDRSWRALEAEKEQTRAKEAQLQELERRVAEREKQLAEQSAVIEKALKRIEGEDPRNGLTPDDYEAAAAEFDKAGDVAKAQAARAEAGKLRQVVQQRQQAAQQEFLQKWDGHLVELVKQDEELKDDKSPLGQNLKEILKHPMLADPVGRLDPSIVKDAYAIARWKTDAGLVPGLKDQVAKLTTEVERLRKATSVKGSGAGAPPTTKSFSEMSEAEQLEALKREAESLDRA